MEPIVVTDELEQALEQRKTGPEETYGEVIWGLLECDMELSDETKRRIAQGRAEYAQGKTIPHEEVKRQLGL